MSSPLPAIGNASLDIKLRVNLRFGRVKGLCVAGSGIQALGFGSVPKS